MVTEGPAPGSLAGFVTVADALLRLSTVDFEPGAELELLGNFGVEALMRLSISSACVYGDRKAANQRMRMGQNNKGNSMRIRETACAGV